jgi:hypothetical protein
MAIGQPSRYGLVFWMVSVALATGLLLFGGVVTLTAIFAYSQIQADGFSWPAVGTSIAAAWFWGILGLIGTCYFSIPIASPQAPDRSA